MVALRQWSEEFAVEPDELGNILVDRQSGARVRKLELHTQDGRLLGAGDTEVRMIAPEF